jgi:hypothetical protein
MESGTILLPVAGRSSRFPGMRPKWLLTAPSGELMLEKALRSIDGYKKCRVIVGALSVHLNQMHGRDALLRALGDRAEIVEFEETTNGPAVTVAEMIKRASVSGSIFIKDCDSWFDAPYGTFDNSVCVVDLRQFPDTHNIPAKSFVVMNKNLLIEEIREKHICSPYISVGGYGFADAGQFMSCYERLSRDATDAESYVSHLILEGIHQGFVFKGIIVSGYCDVGTIEEWNEFRERSKLYIIDIDGVVFRNSSQFIPPLWDDEDVPLPRSIEKLRQLIAHGAQIVFVTSRPERFRQKTEASLSCAGLSWHAAIFGVPHSRRVLVNDFAPSNPYPSAVAVNLSRNSDDLMDYI